MVDSVGYWHGLHSVIAEDLDTLDPDQLRQALRATRAEVAFKQALIDKLTHENAILKRLKFAAMSEAKHKFVF